MVPQDWRILWASKLWAMYPWVCVFIGVLVLCGLVKNPDWLLVAPCRLAGLGFIYANYLCERFWQRLEVEVTRMMYGPAVTRSGTIQDPNGESSPTPVMQFTQQSPSMLAMVGWACAFFTYQRQVQ